MSLKGVELSICIVKTHYLFFYPKKTSLTTIINISITILQYIYRYTKNIIYTDYFEKCCRDKNPLDASILL